MLIYKTLTAGVVMSALLLGSVTLASASNQEQFSGTRQKVSDYSHSIWYDDDCDDPKNDLSGCRGS